MILGTSGEACIPVEMLISTSGCASVSNGSDTRMILHAVHANNIFERNDMTGRVIIKMNRCSDASHSLLSANGQSERILD